MSKRFIGARQTTLAREVELSGTGVHSGAPVSVVLHPAESDIGFRFLVSRRGRIVAETLIGLVLGDETSFLNSPTGFTPLFGKPTETDFTKRFQMGDLITEVNG